MADPASSEGYIGTSACQTFNVLNKGERLECSRRCLCMIQLYQIKELAARSSYPLQWFWLESFGGVLARRKD